MSPSSEDNIEIIPSVAATAGDSSDARAVSPPQTTEPFPQRVPLAAPVIPDPNTRMQLLARVMLELPHEAISEDPGLKEFVELHLGLSVPDIDDNPKSPIYNWDVLSKAFEYIYNAYVDEMLEINSQFESLDVKRSIWLESVSRLDGNRAESRIKNVESWVSNYHCRLNTMKNDLDTSIQVIKTTLNKFN